MSVQAPVARTALRINGVVSAVGGLTVVVGSAPLARTVGLHSPTPIGWIGVMLVFFGVYAMAISTRRGLKPWHVVPFALADAAWVVGSVLLLVMAPHVLTLIARGLLALVAAVAAWFSLAEFRGSREL